MQRITEELIRKRSEHNDMEIGTLEEISMHQERIGKLEHVQHWCKELKILLLHDNLISKIENLGKLKKLEYINFSLNNITKIENLEGCESLQKLDFTLNFIGDLTSVKSIQANIHLTELYLTGNPCADYEGYREYVIATLPKLKELDGTEILISERIKALQRYGEILPEIIKQQKEYIAHFYKNRTDEDFRSDYEDSDDEGLNPADDMEENKRFWKQVRGHCPEVRIELAKRQGAVERAKKEKKPPKKKPPKLFNDKGEPLNSNQARINFTLDDDYWNNIYILDVAVYKYLDTALLDVDVNPFYVKVLIKGKVLQIKLTDEVSPDNSVAKRSQTTGHLVITMPKVNEVIRFSQRFPNVSAKIRENNKRETDYNKSNEKKVKREYLEVQGEFDLIQTMTIDKNVKSIDFVDDPEVPPLE